METRSTLIFSFCIRATAKVQPVLKNLDPNLQGATLILMFFQKIRLIFRVDKKRKRNWNFFCLHATPFFQNFQRFCFLGFMYPGTPWRFGSEFFKTGFTFAVALIQNEKIKVERVSILMGHPVDETILWPNGAKKCQILTMLNAHVIWFWVFDNCLLRLVVMTTLSHLLCFSNQWNIHKSVLLLKLNSRRKVHFSQTSFPSLEKISN